MALNPQVIETVDYAATLAVCPAGVERGLERMCQSLHRVFGLGRVVRQISIGLKVEWVLPVALGAQEKRGVVNGQVRDDEIGGYQSRNMSSRMLPCSSNGSVVLPASPADFASATAGWIRFASTASKSISSCLPNGRTMKSRLLSIGAHRGVESQAGQTTTRRGLGIWFSGPGPERLLPGLV